MNEKIKLGCVNFLNALPLIYPLENGLLPHPFEIQKDVPSALVEKLRKGELDIALASTGALTGLGPDFAYIPEIGICSDGPVHSVLLCYKGDLSGLTRVYPDAASVTGNLLAKIILAKKWDISPQFMPPEKAPVDIYSLKDGNGCVLIGDRALEASGEIGQHLDLGDTWRELTGLPFIYALWIGRKESITDKARIPLYNSYLVGRSMIPQIIASQPDLPLQWDAAIKYLEENIVYEVTENSEAGLSLFLKYAEELA